MNDQDKHAEFMELFFTCQHDMRAFVAASLYNWDKVDDVMQELATVLWKKFDDYDQQHSFGAWARGIARNLILQQYDKHQKQARLFSDDALHALEQAFNKHEETEDDRGREQQALHFCIDQLTERMREMIQLRYYEDMGLHEIAQKTGGKYEAIKKALVRVRKQLLECCGRHLQRQDAQI